MCSLEYGQYLVVSGYLRIQYQQNKWDIETFSHIFEFLRDKIITETPISNKTIAGTNSQTGCVCNTAGLGSD